MPRSIDDIVNDLIDHREGGYVNHPSDPGGETIYGIIVATARRHGYTGSMRNMSKDEAKRIYKAEYWFGAGFDKVAAVYPQAAEEMFDTGVNMGPGIAARFLQEALNMLQDAELAEDGRIGPATISALNGFKARRGQEGGRVLLKVLDCFQGARYRDIVKGRTKSRAFVYGWFAHRIGNVV